MKTISFILFTFIVGIVLTSSVMYHAGSPGHKTGSPGDGNNCTQCHAGSAVQSTGWIESSIPVEGYVPGSVYQVIVHGSHAGAQRYGFEMTSEALGNSKKGAFQVTDNARNQLVDAQGTAITHTDGGISPVNDSASWSFNWVAPDAGTGAVNFYLAVNAANGNGNNTGDVIYLSSISVTEEIAESITQSEASSFSVYPNPARESVFVEINDAAKEISLMNASGAVIQSYRADASRNQKLDISGISPGVYYIKISSSEKTKTERLLVL